MKINITAGECLKNILEKKYPDGCFVPFNEAMLEGTYSAPLFSDDFIKERSAFHGVSQSEYLQKLSGFMNILKQIKEYDEIIMWFGDEPFCIANRKTVLNTLQEYGYCGIIRLNIVNEKTAEIIRQEQMVMHEGNTFQQGI